MRREASDDLMSERKNHVLRVRSPLTRGQLVVIESGEMLGAVTLDLDAYQKKLAEGSVLPIPLEDFMASGGEMSDKSGRKVIPYILNVSKGNLDRFIEENFDEIADKVRDTGILIGNLGWIERFRGAGVKVYGDYGLNVFNEQARRALEDEGVELYMPSHETGLHDTRGIPYMITEHPVESPYLRDRKGAVHRIVTAASGDKTLIY